MGLSNRIGPAFRSAVERVLGNGVDSVNTEQLQTSQGTLFDRSSNDIYEIAGTIALPRNPDNLTATSYSAVSNLTGAASLDDVPDGATLYARMAGRFGNDTDGETSTIQPRVMTANGITRDLDELELSVTGNATYADTGWQELTSLFATGGVVVGQRLRAKVSGGQYVHTRNALGIIIGYRLQ